jgi:hypothetical protein
MAILGIGGQLKLKREAPDPVELDASSINTTSNSIHLGSSSFWSGDRVTLTSAVGLPFNINTALTGPDCPDGHGTYFGSQWLLGANRSHVTSESSAFYKASDASQFYVRAADVGQTTTTTFYVYVDQLGRASFYATRADALRGATNNRVSIFKVSSSDLEIALSVSESDWKIQSLLREWSLNLTAPEVDTTGVGEKFGDAVKSIVSGGGSLDFIVDRSEEADSQDPTALLNLLLMTEKGCKADAEFWMIQNRPIEGGTLLPGDLYYETQLMVTSIAINTRPDEIIAGSLNFVTVGEIALRMGTN